MDRYVEVDEKGFINFEGQRLDDEAVGKELLKNIQPANEYGRFITQYKGVNALVEAFDQPLVVRRIFRQPGLKWLAETPYAYQFLFDLKNLRIDEWDRFHGRDESGRPFVLSRTAQGELFRRVDDLDETSITVEGQRITPPGWLESPPPTKGATTHKVNFLNQEIDTANPIIVEFMNYIEESELKVLVVGSENAHDADHLRGLGHHVTTIDQDLPDSLFNQGSEHFAAYDLIVEQSLYSAIAPSKRQELIDHYQKLLAPQGHLLGIFLILDRLKAPPYGTTEWEVRQRLKKHFKFPYWLRWKHSSGWRKGAELVVYAQKNNP